MEIREQPRTCVKEDPENRSIEMDYSEFPKILKITQAGLKQEMEIT